MYLEDIFNFAIGKSIITIPTSSIPPKITCPNRDRNRFFKIERIFSPLPSVKHFLSLDPPSLNLLLECARSKRTKTEKRSYRKGGPSHTRIHGGSWPFFRAAPHVNQRSPGTSQGAIERGTEASNRDTGVREQRWARRFSKAN